MQRRVVERLRKIVACRGCVEVDFRRNVDVERLAPLALGRLVAVASVGAHAAQRLFGPRAGLQSRTIASATATASRAPQRRARARCRCRRCTASAVVATVP